MPAHDHAREVQADVIFLDPMLPLGLIATSDPFEAPRTRQWNAGIQRQLYRRGVIDVGYVGSAGDDLLRPVDINLPPPSSSTTRLQTAVV